MNYKEYQNARDTVWRLLIDLGISELPINTVKVCAELGIKLHYYEPTTDESDGMSCYINGVPHIFVSSAVLPERRRFTVAHEIGHIILGHVGKFELVNREPSPTDNPIEQAANVFASRLLAPACVLWGCNVQTANQIQELCKISRTAAEYRAERMNELYKRNRFLTSSLEQKVYSQFETFIKQNKF